MTVSLLVVVVGGVSLVTVYVRVFFSFGEVQTVLFVAISRLAFLFQDFLPKRSHGSKSLKVHLRAMLEATEQWPRFRAF